MKRTEKKVREYRSMKEYEKKYYPGSYKKQSAEMSDPDMLGIVLARESLAKFKQLIRKRKVCI